jgi:hypothetical protein
MVAISNETCRIDSIESGNNMKTETFATITIFVFMIAVFALFGLVVLAAQP